LYLNAAIGATRMADDLLKLLISNPFCSDGRIAQRISLGSEGLDDVDAGGALEEEFGGDAEAAAEAERGKLETRRQKLEMGKSCTTIRKTALLCWRPLLPEPSSSWCSRYALKT
jgi:hypothetical protein